MEISGRLQEFAGRLLPGEESARPAELEAFVRTLPHAANAAETSLLKAKLLDVVFRWSVYAHTRFHGTSSGSIPDGIERVVRRRGRTKLGSTLSGLPRGRKAVRGRQA